MLEVQVWTGIPTAPARRCNVFMQPLSVESIAFRHNPNAPPHFSCRLR